MHYLEKIRQQKPLIHHLTNWVTIYDCAQVTRSVGALPVMAHAKEEVEDMVSLAGALVLNIGTLTPEFVEAQILAGRKANEKNIPVVLDIVGCGATPFRTEQTKKILDAVEITVIKGNAGEISVLAGAEAEVRGVESMSSGENINDLCQILAESRNSIVIATGATDIIADKTQVLTCPHGHEIMGQIVGTGCMAASVLGCFMAVAEPENRTQVCLWALEYYEKTAERIAEHTTNPLAFKMQWLDALGE